MSNMHRKSGALCTREQFFDEVFNPQRPEHKIYSALGRKPQILNCDREVFMFNVLICIGFIVLSANLWIALCVCVFGLFNFFLLFKMGECDHMLRQVYFRQIKYKPYYLAQGNVRTISTKRYKTSWL